MVFIYYGILGKTPSFLTVEDCQELDDSTNENEPVEKSDEDLQLPQEDDFEIGESGT